MTGLRSSKPRHPSEAVAEEFLRRRSTAIDCKFPRCLEGAARADGPTASSTTAARHGWAKRRRGSKFSRANPVAGLQRVDEVKRLLPCSERESVEVAAVILSTAQGLSTGGGRWPRSLPGRRRWRIGLCGQPKNRRESNPAHRAPDGVSGLADDLDARRPARAFERRARGKGPSRILQITPHRRPPANEVLRKAIDETDQRPFAEEVPQGDLQLFPHLGPRLVPRATITRGWQVRPGGRLVHRALPGAQGKDPAKRRSSSSPTISQRMAPTIIRSEAARRAAVPSPKCEAANDLRRPRRSATSRPAGEIFLTVEDRIALSPATGRARGPEVFGTPVRYRELKRQRDENPGRTGGPTLPVCRVIDATLKAAPPLATRRAGLLGAAVRFRRLSAEAGLAGAGAARTSELVRPDLPRHAVRRRPRGRGRPGMARNCGWSCLAELLSRAGLSRPALRDRRRGGAGVGGDEDSASAGAAWCL